MPNLQEKINYLFSGPVLLILYNFFANLGNDIYLPNMPHLEHVFSVSPNIMQLTMVAWYAGVALPQIFFGPLTDQIGRKPVLLGGGVCFVIATLLCAISSNIEMFLIGRFFQGVGVCCLNVTSFSILFDLYSYVKSIRITARLNMVGSLSPLIGPIAGSYILFFYGWRVNFFLVMLLSLFCIISLWIKIPESNINLISRALNIKNMYRNYFSLVCNKMFLKNLILYCMLTSGVVSYLSLSPFIIIEVMKVPSKYFGYMQLPVFIAYIMASYFSSIYLKNCNPRNIILYGISLVAVAGFLMTVMSSLLGNNLFIFIGCMVIYESGFGICAAMLIAEMLSADAFLRGFASAIIGFCTALTCVTSCFFLAIIYTGSTLPIAGFILFVGLFSLVASSL